MLLAAVNFTIIIVIIIVILKITKSSIVIGVKSSHFPLIQCRVVIKQFVIRQFVIEQFIKPITFKVESKSTNHIQINNQLHFDCGQFQGNVKQFTPPLSIL